MFKLTKKTTVEEMKGILNANITKVKKADKNLADQIIYAGKHADKATKKDLFDLVKQTIDKLGDALVVPAMAEETPAETPKKKLAKVESEQAIKPKAKKSEEVAEPKKSAKKPAKKAEGVEVLDEVKTKTSPDRVSKFPAEITVGDNTYVTADIKSMEELYEKLNADEEVVLAFYWSKRNLKQYGYFNNYLGTPKSFDNDLDLATVIYASDEFKVAYAVSQYTEAPYTILPDDFEVIDGIKISGHIEFEVYTTA